MGQPRITVITPYSSHEPFLERTICSVLDQGYDNLQYIVVDAGSSDNSAQAIQRYEDEIHVQIHQNCSSISQAINLGLEAAEGEIVAVVTGQDLLLPGALSEVADGMTGVGSTGWLVGQGLKIGQADQTLGVIPAREPDSLASFLMRDSGLLPLSTTFLSRRLIDRHGLLDPSLEYSFDYEYWCRLLAAQEQPRVVQRALAAEREKTDESLPQATIRAGLEHIAVAQRYMDHLPLGQRYALWMNCDVRRRIYALAEAELKGQDGRRYIFQHLLRRPWWITNEAFRRTLLHGISHPLPEEVGRPAA